MEAKTGIRCPNCGMMNEEGDVFCGNCGTKLEGGYQFAQTPVSAEIPPQAAGFAAAGAANDSEKGKSHATASMVLGIIAVVCWFFGDSSLVSVICGAVGLVLAGKAKAEGFEGGTRTAGFVLSLIGLIGGAVVFVACVACVGSLGMLGASIY